jgi:acyl dehydratase
VLTSAPEYRVTARNTSVDSDNKIHDDAVARRLGFRGGLVPGVTVYAYMTRPILAVLGPAWLERGAAAVRFVAPVYEGEELTLRAVPSSAAATVVDVSAVNPAGLVCAVVSASLPEEAPPAVRLAEHPSAPLPADRPPATRAVLEGLATLGAPERRYDADTAAEYCAKFDDPDPRYRGAGAVIHPAFYLDQGNRAVDQNVRLGPWIHTGSEVRHLRRALAGARITTRGRVRRVFEKKGNEFVELDLLLVADDARPVAQLRHVAIYRLRELPG